MKKNYENRNHEVRNHEVRTKLSVEELKTIKAKAKELGMKPATFLRFLGLSAKVPTLDL